MKFTTEEFCIEYCVENSQVFRNRIKDFSVVLDESFMLQFSPCFFYMAYTFLPPKSVVDKFLVISIEF